MRPLLLLPEGLTMVGGSEFADVMNAFDVNLVKAPRRRRSRRLTGGGPPAFPILPAVLPVLPLPHGDPTRATLDAAVPEPIAALATGPVSTVCPTPADRSEQVFLCYSAEDRDRVRRLRRCLLDSRITCWMDVENMLPGSCWEPEIRRALRASRIALVCLSSSSVAKAGYLQREITLALERASEQPEGGIFLVPVRLDRCEVPDRLSHLHYVDLFADDGFNRLLRALRYTPSHR